MLKIDRFVNWSSRYSGKDSFWNCDDRWHFLRYAKKIKYDYNSLGFRDTEWPEDLTDVIWCIGDSFTVGLGQPFNETWPQLLQKKLGKRCINLGENACSNDAILLRTKEVVERYQPKIVVVMWSYFARRMRGGVNVDHDKNDFGNKNDLDNFSKNFELAEKLPTKIIHMLIPNAFVDPTIKYATSKKYPGDKIIFIEQLDYARDGHHFDLKTSQSVADLVAEKINKDIME